MPRAWIDDDESVAATPTAIAKPSSPHLSITELDKSSGYWTATVLINEMTVAVDRRYGSWQTTKHHPDDRTTRHDVVPYVAAMLQTRVRQIEKRETKT